MTEPLYRRLLGAGFDRLPQAVRELHDFTGVSIWDGRADVERGRSLAARIAAALTSLPPEGDDQPLRVTFHAIGEREIWARQFGSALFRSVQYEGGGLLHERVGPDDVRVHAAGVGGRPGAAARRLQGAGGAAAARSCTRSCAPSSASRAAATTSRSRRTCRCSAC